MQLAAQLYTLRDRTGTAEGFRSVLEACSKIGYAGVQLSAVGCMGGDHPEVDAQTARAWLDEFGLVCCATHRPWAALANDAAAEIAFHKALGCSYCAVGSIGAEFGTDYRRFLEEARLVAAALASEGIRFGYHNHSHEFIKDPETGRPSIDILIEGGRDFLEMEIDTYWIAHAGADPAAFIERCAGRVHAIHVKDMEVVAEDGQVMAPVGEGNLNWTRILPTCAAAGTEWLIVEQDTCRRDPVDCLRSSYEFLRNA